MQGKAQTLCPFYTLRLANTMASQHSLKGPISLIKSNKTIPKLFLLFNMGCSVLFCMVLLCRLLCCVFVYVGTFWHGALKVEPVCFVCQMDFLKYFFTLHKHIGNTKMLVFLCCFQSNSFYGVYTIYGHPLQFLSRPHGYFTKLPMQVKAELIF